MTEIRTGIKLEGNAKSYVDATDAAAASTTKLDGTQKVLDTTLQHTKVTADQYADLLKRLEAAQLTATAAQAQAVRVQTQLDEALAKLNPRQKESHENFKRGALSAGEWKNAMRGLPAQITDIVTGLASGQAPMTVAIQQGGQLRDVFHGFGNVATGLQSIITPTRLAMGGLALTAGILYLATKQAHDEQRAIAMAIVTSGNAAGTSADRLRTYANDISSLRVSTGEAVQAIAQLVGTGRVMGSDLPRFANVALQSQRFLGIEVAETVKAFAELGKDPVQASMRLNEGTNYLTASLVKQIQTLLAHGNAAGAASLAQNAWADAQEKSSKTAREQMGLLDRAILASTETAKNWWDQIVGIGRPETLKQQLENVRKLQEEKPLFDLRNPAQKAMQTGELKSAEETIAESIRLADRAARAQAGSVEAQNDQLKKLQADYQSAQVALSKSGQDLQLANTKAWIEQWRDTLKKAFDENEIDARNYQSEILALDLTGYDAQTRALDAAIKEQQARLLKKDSPEALLRASAVQGLLAQRINIEAERRARQAAEDRGEFNIAPKAQSLPGDALRRGLSADYQRTADDERNDGAQQVALMAELSAANKRMNAEAIMDARARAEALLAIETEEYRKRIANTELNSTERKNVENEFVTWRINRERQLNEQLKSQWQRTLEAWADNERLFRETWDSAVTASIGAGEEAWKRWVRTGKLSLKELENALIDIASSYAYRQLVGAGFRIFSGGGAGGSSDPALGPIGPQEGASAGGRATAARAGSAGAGGVTLVNTSSTPLQVAGVQQRSDGSLEVILAQVEGYLADRLGSGQGSLAQSFEGRYGMRPTFSS